MVYLKSVLAGAGSTGVVIFGGSPLPALGISLLAFAAGFYWQFRRAR